MVAFVGSFFNKVRAYIHSATRGTSQPSQLPQMMGRYDAAASGTDADRYWANADALDADSANSRDVRSRLVMRSRYEVANNGFADGMVQTLATDLVGIGPTLRMQTRSKPFNQAVEAVWRSWAKAVQLRRKLWTMAHAKVQDGEAFAIMQTNPKLKHPIQLDFMLIETEQVQSPFTVSNEYGYSDGLRYDQYNNIDYYEVLTRHPGGGYASLLTADSVTVPAEMMLHWLLMRRPGQHRGVPEFRSTLQVGASSRRWREATVAAAETAADFSIVLKTSTPPEQGIYPVTPMSTMEIEKRMMTALPYGWEQQQMKAEHPNASYESFHKAQINETARPKSMPYNKAACDSSSYNYASGRLDHQTYYASLDVEREDGSDLVLEKLYAEFWREAVLVYGWAADPENPPPHSFDWPNHPEADAESEAKADDIKLKNGSLSLKSLCSKRGIDFDDLLTDLADECGVSEDEMKVILRNARFNDKGAQASQQQADNAAENAANSNTPTDAAAKAWLVDRINKAVFGAQTYSGSFSPQATPATQTVTP